MYEDLTFELLFLSEAAFLGLPSATLARFALVVFFEALVAPTSPFEDFLGTDI